MKTLIKLALITASISLIACADGMHQVEDNNAVVQVIEVQEPIINAPVEVIVITPEPYKLPNRLTVTTDNSISCIKDTSPLILVDGVLTDNCSNKYGSVL